MAGRIRTIKPEILEDTKVAELTHLEYRLFIGALLLADDYGNLRGDADYVRGQVVWGSRESRETVAKALGTLARVSLLIRYTVRGQVYYRVSGWDKHQRVDKPGKPRMPGKDQEDKDDACNSRESREDSLGNPGLPGPTSDLRPPSNDPEGDPERGASRRPREKRGSLLAAGWRPSVSSTNAKAETEAKARGVDIGQELQKLRDWAANEGKRGKDWDARWRLWLSNARPATQSRGGHGNVMHEELERLRREEAAQS